MYLQKYIIFYGNVLKTHKKPWKFIISQLLVKAGLCKFFLIKKDDFVLRFYPSAMSKSLWVDKNDRIEDENFFRRYLKPGNVVVDVGANIGSLTLVASSMVKESGKVYAIEPHPQIYQYLCSNIQLNQRNNIRSLNFAVGNMEGSIHFSNITTDDMNSILNNEDIGISVPIKTLDTILLNEPVIHLLKIDVEGYEKNVLMGAMKIIHKVQCIYFESFETNFKKYNYSTTDVLKFLLDNHFRIFRFQEDYIFEIDMNYVSLICENLLAIRNLGEFQSLTGLQIKK
jgi:FkbM family methyltransferase